MSNAQQKPHVIFRLVLAKALYKKGLELCKTDVDIFSFSHGLISLHDALDNFVGAIITSIGSNPPSSKKYFIDLIDFIEDEEKKKDQNFHLISKSELKNLNTIRNNIKHQGIAPNIPQAKTLLNPIFEFLKTYSLKYFSLDWELISLADLIREQKVKDNLKEVEKLIDAGDFKEALEKMAIIKFNVFDEMQLRYALNPRYSLLKTSKKDQKLEKNIFPQMLEKGLLSDLYDRSKLIEKGIDRDLMDKFEELTAMVGINNKNDWKYIFKHSFSWHNGNWTKEISLFCFDFLVDAVLKNQSKIYPTASKDSPKIHKIRFLDQVNLYNKDDELIYRAKKDEERYAFLFGRIDGKWELYTLSDRTIILHNANPESDLVCYFTEGDEEKISVID